MKKFILVAALATFGLASCKKDYTCDCTYTSGSNTFTTTSKITNAKKKDAEKTCDGLEASGYSCTLN